VGLGCATCLEGLDLKTLTAVVAVGAGSGATQSIAPPGSYRRLMFGELKKHTPPYLIIDLMQDLGGNDEFRQFGIADILRRATTFTGKFCTAWAGGRAGRDGDIAYAIQGNIMVGEPVIADAEFALLNTQGDVADKLMAAMEAARAQGGDSRCTPYAKSSHIAYMVVARIGDIDAPCLTGDDCADGTYFLDFNVSFQHKNDPDPVLQLEQMFATWRAGLIGRPDHLRSSAAIQPQRIAGDGQDQSQLKLTLIDWQGNRITHGGAAITMTHDPSSAGSSTIGAAVDHGDGTYSVPLTAGRFAGEDVFKVIVDDGVSPVTIYPKPSLEVGTALRLRADVASISAGSGDDVNLTLQASPPFSGRTYLLMLSASGTDPGFAWGNVHVPLNYDTVLLDSIQFANVPPLENTEGTLDSSSKAKAALKPGPGLLTPLVGATLSFAYVTLSPDDFASNPIQVLIVP
jgi:uncharacterized Ntn-hydrolase superfamily protein